jgi:hypothetical protein
MNDEGLESIEESIVAEGPIQRLSLYKHQKKKAANDAQLLMNRIALLQKEEERAQRKIERTRERAIAVLAIRDENERKIQEFISAADEQKMHRELLHQQNAATEEETKALKARQIEKLMMQKREIVKDSRITKHKLRNDVIKMKEDDVRRKQIRHEELKQKEMEVKLRREEKKREHEKRVREAFEKKAQAEAEEVQRASELVRMLEQKEREWIEKLRYTQVTQEQTFVELESALKNNSPEVLRHNNGDRLSTENRSQGGKQSYRLAHTSGSLSSSGRHQGPESFKLGKQERKNR